MCSRTRTEVLARNLAFEYFRGVRDAADDTSEDRIKISEMADLHWRSWENTAGLILTTLDKHDD